MRTTSTAATIVQPKKVQGRGWLSGGGFKKKWAGGGAKRNRVGGLEKQGGGVIETQDGRVKKNRGVGIASNLIKLHYLIKIDQICLVDLRLNFLLCVSAFGLVWPLHLPFSNLICTAF